MMIALICLALAVSIFLVVAYRYSRKKVQFKSTWQSEFYFPLKLTEHELMKVVNESCPSGSEVYVLSISSGELIAVKKLVNSRSISSKALKAEVRTIAKIRHKNITRICGFCFTDEMIFLIYEFTQNGSLHDMLSRPGIQLQWYIRLKIAIGVAQALAYISKDYVPHLLHRNLSQKIFSWTKILIPSSLILLLTLSLEKLLFSIWYAQTPNPVILHQKTITVRKQMDVYSFGVVLLELVTGQRAEIVEEGSSGEFLDIVKQVRRKINLTNGAAQVLDQKILSKSCQSDMLKTLDIALDCTAVTAEQRPSLLQVIKRLEGISSSVSASTEKLPVCA